MKRRKFGNGGTASTCSGARLPRIKHAAELVLEALVDGHDVVLGAETYRLGRDENGRVRVMLQTENGDARADLVLDEFLNIAEKLTELDRFELGFTIGLGLPAPRTAREAKPVT